LDRALFIRRNTVVTAPALVPEIRLRLATEITPMWQATEEIFQRSAVPPPFWAFAWAGGQALARYLLDHPMRLPVGQCSTLGPVRVLSRSPRQWSALLLCSPPRSIISRWPRSPRMRSSTKSRIEVTTADLIDASDSRWQVVTAGDVCYEQPLAGRVAAWLRFLARRGCLVLIGDPGRAYLPTEGLGERARYLVPTSRELEGCETRDGVVWEMLPR